jgi:hypothetical protein
MKHCKKWDKENGLQGIDQFLSGRIIIGSETMELLGVIESVSKT